MKYKIYGLIIILVGVVAWGVFYNIQITKIEEAKETEHRKHLYQDSVAQDAAMRAELLLEYQQKVEALSKGDTAEVFYCSLQAKQFVPAWYTIHHYTGYHTGYETDTIAFSDGDEDYYEFWFYDKARDADIRFVIEETIFNNSREGDRFEIEHYNNYEATGNEYYFLIIGEESIIGDSWNISSE